MALNKGFKIIGISVETSNAVNETSFDIMKLWQRFQTENILGKVPNRLNDDIFSIYTDYESDFTGKYTCFLGVSVSSLDSIPEGMIGREFPAANFDTFLAQGELPFAIIETWNDIWSQDADLNRTYSYDYEVYSDCSRNGDQSEVSIYIAVE